MLESLITSKVRRKVLVLLFSSPGTEFYVRQISREIGEEINAVRGELERLEGGGLLVSRVSGNMKYYTVEKTCPIFNDLKSIILKEEGAVRLLRDALRSAKELEFAFIYGSFATGEIRPTSDIDLMIIGKPEQTKIALLIRKIERDIHRDINYTILPKKELLERKTGFMQNIIKSPKLMVKGEENELKRLVGAE